MEVGKQQPVFTSRLARRSHVASVTQKIQDLKVARRILVLGMPGSGKTTFSKKLGQALSLPVIHLDHEFWGQELKLPSQETWVRRVHEACEKKTWVMDGTYTPSLSSRLKKADAVIYLQCSRPQAFFRVLIRAFKQFRFFKRHQSKEFRERLSWYYLKSLWRFNGADLNEIRSSLRFAHGVVLFLGSNETKKLLKAMKPASPPASDKAAH